MLHKTKGIVFKTIKYAESSVISHIYTEDFGLQSYIINAVRSIQSKTKISLLQPLSLLELVVYYVENKNLQRTKEVKPAVTFQKIPFDIHRSSIALLLTEVLMKAIREQHPDKELFHYLYDSVIFLDKTEKPFANFHLSLLIHLTKYLGFSPDGKFGLTTPFFDLQEGKFIKALPRNSDFLEKNTARYFSELLEFSPEEAGTISLNRQQRKILLEKILIYYSFHLSNFKDILSPQILEDIFD